MITLSVLTTRLLWGSKLILATRLLYGSSIHKFCPNRNSTSSIRPYIETFPSSSGTLPNTMLLWSRWATKLEQRLIRIYTLSLPMETVGLQSRFPFRRCLFCKKKANSRRRTALDGSTRTLGFVGLSQFTQPVANTSQSTLFGIYRYRESQLNFVPLSSCCIFFCRPRFDAVLLRLCRHDRVRPIVADDQALSLLRFQWRCGLYAGWLAPASCREVARPFT